MSVSAAGLSEQSLAAAGRQRVQLILTQLDQLPTLPAIVLRVLEATQSDKNDLGDVAQIIESDPALASRMLSLAQRANLGVRSSGLTVARAVGLLGLSAVRSAVLAIKVYETFAALEPSEPSPLRRDDVWKHTFAVACAAKLLAAAPRHGLPIGRVPPEEAFIAGLLHDLGKLALDACLPKSYGRAVTTAAARRACLCDVEAEFFGLDHTVVGRRLATRWKLPEYAAECCWLHHHALDALPNSIAAKAHVEIVHLADRWVRRQRIGYSGHVDLEPLSAALASSGLSESQLDDLSGALLEQVEQQCAIVGLGNVTSARLYNRALAEANEELGRLNLALSDTNRQLATRSRCFDALTRFTSALAVRDDLVDVCKQVAMTFQQLVATPAAAAFALQPDQRLATVAWVGAAGQGCDVIIVAESREQVDTATVMVAAARAGQATAPPSWVAPVTARLANRDGGENPGDAASGGMGSAASRTDHPCWLLPIAHGDEWVGGVLYCSGGGTLFQQLQPDLPALTAAFGLALAGAASRAGAIRLHEDLAKSNRQLRQAQSELVRTRSLSMIAAMAAGAAHELNNPLAVISGRAQLLRSQLVEPKQRQALEIVNEQALRASAIVSELMAFAKPDPPRLSDVSIGTLIERVCRHRLSSASLTGEQLSWQIADPHAVVRIDVAQITQILDALLANAIEATQPDAARIHVNSHPAASDEAVVVSVADNGVGMTPDVLEHALDPFFSHRPAGRGRGLGLSMAHRLTETNGGRLWLESTPGKGTRVYVELPNAATPR